MVVYDGTQLKCDGCEMYNVPKLLCMDCVKKLMLECVGEGGKLKIKYYNKTVLSEDTTRAISFGYNQAKQEIRKKIEEVMK